MWKEKLIFLLKLISVKLQRLENYLGSPAAAILDEYFNPMNHVASVFQVSFCFQKAPVDQKESILRSLPHMRQPGILDNRIYLHLIIANEHDVGIQRGCVKHF
jgi:hypothetical protein